MVLVEVTRKSYLASLVPVIVNAILNDHQIVVDIVAFVAQGDFPRSRLGEKQRGKILGSWVTRKMRTIAQFSIRDADGGDTQSGESHGRYIRRSKTGSIEGSGSQRRASTVPEHEQVSRAPVPASQPPASMELRRHQLVDAPYPSQEDLEEQHFQEILNHGAYHEPLPTSPSDGRSDAAGQQQRPAPPPLNLDVSAPAQGNSGSTPKGGSGSGIPLVSPDDGFDFGPEFSRQTVQPSPTIEVQPPPGTSGSSGTAAQDGSTHGHGHATASGDGHESLRNDMASLRLDDDAPATAASSGPTTPTNWAGDWPQEALMYQRQMSPAR